MANLGDRYAQGALTAANKVTPGTPLWVVTFTPRDISAQPDYEMWHAAIKGPGGYFLVYIDDKLFGVGENGLINEYSPRGSALYGRDGQTITLNWSIATSPAPEAWIYLREPEVGKI